METASIIRFEEVDQLRDARSILLQEAAAVREVADALETSFSRAVALILECEGRLIVTGMGKAGLIAQKLAATFSSTGTPAQFLHPSDAVHGDVGCLRNNDVVLALSNSGETEEITRLLPSIEHTSLPLVAITRDENNTLGRAATEVLCLGRIPEAGSLALAPTSSTTAMLALGDALALIVSRERGFTAVDFARVHPAGSLGRKLRTVSEVMRTRESIRIAAEDDSVRDVLVRLHQPGRRTGAIAIVDADDRFVGLFTDSDLVRLLEQRRDELIDGSICAVMTHSPTTISPEESLSEALEQLSEKKISELPVVNEHQKLLGIVDITDVLTDAVAAA